MPLLVKLPAIVNETLLEAVNNPWLEISRAPLRSKIRSLAVLLSKVIDCVPLSPKVSVPDTTTSPVPAFGVMVRPAAPLELLNFKPLKVQVFVPELEPNVLSADTICSNVPPVKVTIPAPVTLPLTVTLVAPESVPVTVKSPVLVRV